MLFKDISNEFCPAVDSYVPSIGLFSTVLSHFLYFALFSAFFKKMPEKPVPAFSKSDIRVQMTSSVDRDGSKTSILCWKTHF